MAALRPAPIKRSGNDPCERRKVPIINTKQGLKRTDQTQRLRGEREGGKGGKKPRRGRSSSPVLQREAAGLVGHLEQAEPGWQHPVPRPQRPRPLHRAPKRLHRRDPAMGNPSLGEESTARI